jgi:hypothetical protein
MAQKDAKDAGPLNSSLFIRLPAWLRDQMREEGAQRGLSMSDVARLRMLNPCPDPAKHPRKG